MSRIRPLTSKQIREGLITAGVKNLKEFGYPDVNAENIFTTYVYNRFFLSMVKENFGVSTQVDPVLKELQKQLEAVKMVKTGKDK